MTVTPLYCKLASGIPKKSLPDAARAGWWNRASDFAVAVFGLLLKGASLIPHVNKFCSRKAYSLLPEVKFTAYKL